MSKTVSFFGHRKIDVDEAKREEIKQTVEELIKGGGDVFLFGSRSEFDTLCWEIVTELQAIYPHIKRVSYNAPHEMSFTSKEEREWYEKISLQITKQEEHYKDYEEAVDVEKAYKANQNAYIIRNQVMIDNSDVCVFYYDESYLPPVRKHAKRDVIAYQPQSGTGIAYKYARQKKKQIINLFSSKQ